MLLHTHALVLARSSILEGFGSTMRVTEGL